MASSRSEKRAFTLVELLLVAAAMDLLARFIAGTKTATRTQQGATALKRA